MTEYHEIYHSEGPKGSMLLWNPYFRTMFVEAKSTETGNYPPCVMFTIGRRVKPTKEINSNAIRVLPKKTRENILEKYSNETLRKAPLSLKDKFQNAVIDSINKINRRFLKIAGITMVKEGGSIEIFEYWKLRKVEDILPIIYGSMMALGVLCRMNDYKIKDIKNIRMKTELNLGQYLMLGYNRAKERKWK